MELSKYNIFGKIHNSGRYFIVNVLSGQADILEPQYGQMVERGEIPDVQIFIDKGYLVDPLREKMLFEKKHREFHEKRNREEIQLFFVPWYQCNLACTYCHQEQHIHDSHLLDDTVIDAFYHYVDITFADRRKYITIYGGEPFLEGNEQAEKIKKIMEKAWSRNLDVSVMTNGYTVYEHIPLLRGGNIREILVTLDGTEEIHDSRRPLRCGTGTFEKIVRGIDEALTNNLRVTLRVVVDRKNIGNLPELADFSIGKKWVENPLFRTIIGRNYELHRCSSYPQDRFSHIELFAHWYGVIEKSPQFLKFHQPAFGLSKFWSDNGKLPDALFNACPGCKSEWAFDYTGSIYSCAATAVKNGERLGTFYPEVTLDNEKVRLWQERDIMKNKKCSSCNQNLVCGGGCATVAKNKTGTLYGCDCRPVNELMGLGMSTYFKMR
jgi:uncharacterized protein